LSLFNHILISTVNQTSTSVDLTVIENVVHPVGHTVTSSFEWKNQDGDVVATTKDITYPLIGEEDIGLIVNVIYEDLANNYNEVFADSITFNMPKREEVGYQFVLDFNINLFYRDQLNTDTMRLMSYLPKWSSANKNFLSNFSKVNSPYGDTISNMFFDMANIITVNLSTESFFEYPTALYSSVLVSPPLYIKIDNKNFENIGYAKSSSILNYPISSIKEEKIVYPSKLSFIKNRAEVFDGKLLSKDCIIYIQPTSAISNPEIITIFGFNSEGSEISESLVLINTNAISTKLKYKFITDISSNVDLKVSTYISTDSCHSFRSSLLHPKRIANNNGAFFDPVINIDVNSIEINQELGLNKSTIRRFYCENNIDNLFVSNLMDILYLSGGRLFAAKPRLRVETPIDINSSYNNNDVVYIDNSSPIIGEVVNFTIDINKAANIFDSENIQILVTHGDNKYFVTQDVGLSTSKDTWIKLSNRKANISFGFPINDLDDITVKVYSYGFASYFCAGSHVDYINSYHLMDNVDDMIIFNNKLVVEKDSQFFELKPSRLCFVYDDSYIYTDTNMNNGELVYE
jgi:hypothetical protein